MVTMNLIDRDAILDKVHDFFCSGCPVTNKAVCNCCDCRGVMDEIEAIPTVNAKPVVRGEWQYKEDGLDSWHECSVCGYCNFHYAKNNYCPNCGAKMDGGEE